MIKNRKVLLVIVAVVALLAIYNNPQESGGIVRDALGAFADLVDGMFDFAGAVMR